MLDQVTNAAEKSALRTMRTVASRASSLSEIE
jgi:hypothetical protein